jgi:hypothetical protein
MVVLAFLAALGVSAWVGRDWVLISAADLWIVSDPIDFLHPPRALDVASRVSKRVHHPRNCARPARISTK